MMRKFIQILIFACFWLCFVPWLVILVKDTLNQETWYKTIFAYTTLFFILIVVYWLIKSIFDHLYTRQEIKKRVRKITIKQQLKRLERGEIDIAEAQDIRTFTKVNVPKSPKARRSTSCKKPKPQEMQDLSANRPKSPAAFRKKGETVKNAAPAVPVSTDMPPTSDLPPYTDEMLLLEKV